MSVVVNSPTLSYVSSQDVQSSAPSGATNYMILFDASNASASNVIMFEYKFQTINSLIPNLDNTSFGFVAVENAIQSGIVNQYIISVPVAKNTLDGIVEESIQVRVYYGDLSSADIVVSEWSNELGVHLPPVTPIIYTNSSPNFQGAYYDPSTNDLFVFLQESTNEYNFNNINFIVCFFYQNASGTTLWKVSDPTQALQTSFGGQPFRYIQVDLEGTVSTDPSYNKVYVSIHSVYDWQNSSYSGPSYHSISYISNEVAAVLSSDDKTPDITSVEYNVYTTTLPGDQTMTVNWLPPGNSAIPAFEVNYYNLYYSLDGGATFTLVPGAGNISSETFEYDVNVGPGVNGLNLNCGESIVFRVNAIDAQGSDTPSDPSSATNIFKYSEAVTSLTIKNTTFNESTSEVGLTVEFNGVSDTGSPNKGCGTGLQYVVKINGSDYNGTGTLVYSSGSPYSIVYTGLSIPQVGDVTVYLQTQDTNSLTVSPLNGAPATVPYVTNNVVLNTVDYDVYLYGGLNDDQLMNLSWSGTSLAGWTLVNYIVEYSTDEGTNWIALVPYPTSLSYVFNASPFAINNSTNISFRVLENLINVNGSTTYQIVSNTESKYTFKYATEVENPILDWSVANTSNSSMDISLRFNNPLTTGVNNGLSYFAVTVYDTMNNIINTQNIAYVAGGDTYIVLFDDIPYSFFGNVVIEPFVVDSNSSDLLTSPNYDAILGYETSTVPVFNNLNVSNGFVSGNIYTHDVLKLTGKVFPVDLGILGDGKEYQTDNTTPGFEINYTTLLNGTLEYSFSINIATFFGSSEITGCVIGAANNAGIGSVRKPFLPSV